MKKWMTILAVCSMAVTGFGAAMMQDTSELALDGTLDFDSANGTQILLDVFYGYFVMDYLEVGPTVSFVNQDDLTAWRLGVQGEYDFDLGTELVPFVGLSLKYAQLDADTIEGETVDVADSALVFGGTAGAKYFITEDVAISADLAFDWATDKIYPKDNFEYQSTDARLELGLRFFF
jgi:hypothetical protein